MDFFSTEHLKALAEQYLVPFAINLVLAALVFIVGRWVARGLKSLMGRLLERRLDASLVKFLCSVAYALMMVIVIIAALDRLGVKTTAAVAVLGAAGLAVGLALQGSLGNFAAGVMIILFRPYRVGDVISAAGQVGKVDEIQTFNTVLLTADNRVIIIPNGQVIGGIIENITQQQTRRIDLVFGVGYGDDLKKAKAILERLVAEDDRILKDPAPQVAVSELADSSVNFVCRPWVKGDDYWTVRFDLIERVKLTFDAEGISIPFPQRDVHIYNDAA